MNKSDQSLKRTALFDLHVAAGAKLVPFAGYEMPVQYRTGIMQEHLHTRSASGLFDVSHMGQVIVRGKNAALELEKLVPVDLVGLEINQQLYGVLTNQQGGIRDDLILCKWAEDEFFLVVNAGCKEQDLVHLQANLAGCEIEYRPDRALLALQGPEAIEVLRDIAPEVARLTFMQGCHAYIKGFDCCYITRSGYTGEDGFEISIPDQQAPALAELLLANRSVQWIGLGARDSLRLEAGLCLYGHDLNESTTPVEAGLQWSISRARRPGGVRSGGFQGAETIFDQMTNGVSRKRVGLLVEGRAPVREGSELVDGNGRKIGVVTSGGYAPTLEAPIAMGYVNSEFAGVGAIFNALVRDKPREVRVCKMPFVAQRYFRG